MSEIALAFYKNTCGFFASEKVREEISEVACGKKNMWWYRENHVRCSCGVCCTAKTLIDSVYEDPILPWRKAQRIMMQHAGLYMFMFISAYVYVLVMILYMYTYK